MKVFSSNNINDIYSDILQYVINNGYRVGECYQVDDVAVRITNVGLNFDKVIVKSRARIGYIVKELLFYESKTDTINYIFGDNAIWQNYSKNGVVVNYNALIDYEYLVKELKNNTRHCIVTLYHNNYNTYDVIGHPCTLSIMLYRKGDKVDMKINMRASDVTYGLPYDIVYFAYLANRICAKYYDTYREKVFLNDILIICHTMQYYLKK